MDSNFNRQEIDLLLNQVKQTNAKEEKNIKVAKLIVLLVKIEKELDTVGETLHKLWEHQRKLNPNSEIISQITEKINTVDRLTNKVRMARLNLNYYFI